MKTSAKQGTILLTYSSILFIVTSYIINLWLGRYLGPVGYGIYGIVASLMTIVNLLQNSGTPQVISKMISENESRSDQILKCGIIIQGITGFLIGFAYFLLAKPLAILLNDKELTIYLQLSSLIFPIYGIFALYVFYYNGLHYFKKQSLLNIIYALSKTLSIFLLGYFFNIFGVIIGFVISPLITLLSGVHLPNFFSARCNYKKLILYSIPLIGFAFLSTMQQSIDLFFIKGLMNSDSAPGYYTANQNISRIIFFGLSAFSIVLYPSISKSVSLNNLVQTKKLIQDSLRYILVLLVPGTLLISSTSRELISLIYSERYLPGADSLSILIIGIGFLTFFTALANILNGAGYTNKSIILSASGVLLTSVFSYILIPPFGMNGAALATTIGSFVAMFFAVIIVYNKFKQLVSLVSLLRIFISSLTIYSLSFFTHLEPIMLPFEYLSLGLLYCALLFLMKEINSEDIQNIKSLIPVEIPLLKNK